jgi:uncharacterized membrane protein (UPF0127 family)
VKGLSGRCVGCVITTALAAAGSGCEGPAAAPAPRVTINGRSWRVEVATTSDGRYRGLSDRESLDANAGMLFVYPTPDVLDFCMRQCLIPLDIAFIDADLRVVKTWTMAVEPYGFARRTYSSVVPAQYALEVNAGSLAAAGVKVGDKVEFSSNVPPAAKAQADP